jgi:hypothetical protein
MTESPHIRRLREMLEAEPEEPISLGNAVLGKVGDVAPLLSCKQVQALCKRVDAVPRELKRWSSKDKGKRYAIYFWFEVVEPVEYEGAELMMYCRWNPKWQKQGIDYRSKLYKCACIAAGRRLRKRDSIETAFFSGKLFVCTVAEVGTAPGSYSAIETIIDKLTG